MKYFIDTHCHILPGVDDGPAHFEDSLEMARIAADDGIGTIVATPHIIEGYYDGAGRVELLTGLAEKLSAAGIDIALVAGAEVPMSTCLAGDEQVLRSLAIAEGRFLLMETADTTFAQVASAAYRVRLCGLWPVLAHPERAGFVQEDPSRLAQLSDKDVYCQITAASIEGGFGKKIRRTCLDMARHGLVHLVATDAHSHEKRLPRLSGAYEKLSLDTGKKTADALMFENPRRLLNDEPLLSINAKTVRTSRIGRLFRS